MIIINVCVVCCQPGAPAAAQARVMKINFVSFLVCPGPAWPAWSQGPLTSESNVLNHFVHEEISNKQININWNWTFIVRKHFLILFISRKLYADIHKWVWVASLFLLTLVWVAATVYVWVWEVASDQWQVIQQRTLPAGPGMLSVVILRRSTAKICIKMAGDWFLHPAQHSQHHPTHPKV